MPSTPWSRSKKTTLQYHLSHRSSAGNDDGVYTPFRFQRQLQLGPKRQTPIRHLVSYTIILLLLLCTFLTSLAVFDDTSRSGFHCRS
jgi:hypothetical protein